MKPVQLIKFINCSNLIFFAVIYSFRSLQKQNCVMSDVSHFLKPNLNQIITCFIVWQKQDRHTHTRWVQVLMEKAGRRSAIEFGAINGMTHPL